MGLFADIVISIPIGITYNVLVHKVGEIFNDDLNYKDKIQRNLLLSFGGGIFGFVIASMIFNNGKYKNRAVKFGLYLGSILLLLHSIGYNWSTMDNDTKFIIMIVTLASLIWYTYERLDKTDEKTNIGKKKSSRRQHSNLPAVHPVLGRPELFNENDTDYDEIVNYFDK